jgi:2-oxoglutarate ferredoxin oxidoreductase subunit beta
MAVKDYLRERFLPHIWCPGCGHGIVMANLVRAVERLKLAKKEIVVISGIGCSSRMPGYLDFHTMHTLHGRALAFATGVKFSRPDLKVIVPMGDGDAAAIGGNHLIHAARRNIDITAIVMNNRIYGMTGGQSSPMTPQGGRSTTASAGTIDPPFDLAALAMGAGAGFVARGTTYHAKEMIDLLAAAINHRGFSLVEVLSQCPTYYGRKNKLGDAVDLMRGYKEITAPTGSRKLAENPDLIARGLLLQKDRPEYTDSYLKLASGGSNRASQPQASRT